MIKESKNKLVAVVPLRNATQNCIIRMIKAFWAFNFTAAAQHRPLIIMTISLHVALLNFRFTINLSVLYAWLKKKKKKRSLLRTLKHFSFATLVDNKGVFLTCKNFTWNLGQKKKNFFSPIRNSFLKSNDSNK